MLPQRNTIRYGNDSIVFRGSSLWSYLPNDIKSQTSVCSCKKCIENWSKEGCKLQKFVNKVVIYVV